MYHLFPRVWGKRAFLARMKAFPRLVVQWTLAATTHPLTHPCLPLNVGLRGGFPQVMTEVLQIMTQLIIQEISEISSTALEPQNSGHRPFFFCMQIQQYSKAEATVIWGWCIMLKWCLNYASCIDGLGLILQWSRAKSTDTGPEHCRRRGRYYLYYVTVY